MLNYIRKKFKELFMPNIKSQVKRLKVTARQDDENTRIRTFVRNQIKKFNAVIEAKDVEKAKALLPETVSAIDKAKCIYHKNTISRKKAHVSKALSDLEASLKA